MQNMPLLIVDNESNVLNLLQRKLQSHYDIYFKMTLTRWEV